PELRIRGSAPAGDRWTIDRGAATEIARVIQVMSRADTATLEIQMPRGATLEILGFSARVEVHDTRGALRLKSAIGPVLIENARGTATVETSAGNVEVRDAAGSV